MKDLGPERISFLDWSADSGRLLIDLHGGLTGSVETPDRNLYKKPGVSAWVAYFNTKTKRFELTDRLRARNKGARKRWKAMDNDNEEAPEEGFVPPSLDGADRAEFEKKEADWRDKLDDDAAQIKDPAKRLGMRARSTWYHLINVREERLPIYEEAKSGDAKQSQP